MAKPEKPADTPAKQLKRLQAEVQKHMRKGSPSAAWLAQQEVNKLRETALPAPPVLKR